MCANPLLEPLLEQFHVVGAVKEQRRTNMGASCPLILSIKVMQTLSICIMQKVCMTYEILIANWGSLSATSGPNRSGRFSVTCLAKHLPTRLHDVALSEFKMTTVSQSNEAKDERRRHRKPVNWASAVALINAAGAITKLNTFGEHS